MVDVDPRIEARRAEIRLARLIRRRRQWLATSVVVTVIALVYALTRSPLLDVDHVVVVGAVRTPANEVWAASGIKLGDALTDVDADRSVSGVLELPWVEGATVARRWSGTVELAVTERSPAAALEDDAGTVALVDGDRRVLAVVPSAPPELPLVRGLPLEQPGATAAPALDGALALARALTPGVRTRVVAVEVAGDELQLALRPAGRVRVGTVEQLDQKLRALQTLFAQVDLTDLCVLDVRVPSTAGLTRDEACD